MMSVVLIATDEPQIRSFLRTALQADTIQDLTVLEVDDSESCFLTCKHLRPNLILLSSGFPDAHLLCENLKADPELRHIRILMIGENEGVIEQFAAADDYVTKPIRETVLLRRTNMLLREQALEEEVGFQREILSQMGDAVVAVDANSNVIYWNPEAERMYGVQADEILGKPLDNAYRIENFGPNQREIAVSIADKDGWREEGVHIRHDGERLEVEVAVRSLRNESKLPFGYITVIRNITERKRIEAALNEEHQFGDVLRDTAAALTRTLDPQGVMQLMLEHLDRVVPHKAANIMMLEGDKARVAFSHGYSSEEEARLSGLSLSIYDFKTYQQMLAADGVCLVADTTDNPIWTDISTLHWVKSYLGVSIRAYDHVIGFLNIDADTANAFAPIHAERLRIFTDQAAIAIENAQLYDAIYRDAVEMRALHRATAFLYGTNLFASENLTDMCEKIVGVVVNEFGKVDCGVLLVDEEDGSLVRVARAGSLPISANDSPYVNGGGLVATAIRTGKLIYVPDLRKDARTADSSSVTLSELVMPLHTPKGVIGALDLQSPRFDAFDEHDVRLLEVFAERAATAIENVKLYNEIRRYAEGLERRVQERTAELNRVKERVEAILNHSSDAILLIRPNGAIQQGNRAFDMMFGYNADEAFGQNVTLLAEPEFREPLEQALTWVVEKNNAERLEIVARRLNGLTFDADVTLSPVISAPQQITSVVCSVRDITRRKRLENDLREALQKEREVNEMKSQFVARASHEFRTPLAVILTSSDLLRSYGNRMTPEQREEKLARLQSEVRNLAMMLDDLLTISKGEELKEFNPELIDLQNLSRQVTHRISDGIGIQHHLVVESHGNCTSIYVDPKLIERIITNLLSNAVKYSPVGSTIQLSVTCDTSKTVLEVRDEGIGIPEDDQRRLFEAFHRAKNVEHISGTGLGLAIVKQAVDLHGGDVTCKSQLGKGTVFTVVLPNLAVKEKSQ